MRAGRGFLIGVGVLGWLAAAALALWLVWRTGFLGIALIGVAIWFICIRVELEKEGAVGHELTPTLFAEQIKARQRMSRSERAALSAEQTALAHWAGFIRQFGIALAGIGLGGFVLYQL